MTDVLIHEYNFFSYYTGNSRVIGPMEGIPPFWTDAVLPEMENDQFAVLSAGSWVVTSQPQKELASRTEPDSATAPSVIGPMVF